MKVFSNKKTIALFILTIMLVISLISLSVAWFHRLLTKDGFDLQTGDIVLSFNAYEYEDSKLTELASGGLDTTERDSQMPTVSDNSKLLLTGDTKYADISETGKSYYLKIERGTDSIDVDYTLSFMLEGKSVAVPVDADVTNDLTYLGGFEFRIVKITPRADAVAPSQEGLTETEKLLAAYCVQNHVNDATITSAYSSLSVVETHIHEGSIDQNNTVDFYRLDIRRVQTTQNVADYAGRKIQLRAQLNATQDGAYQGTQHYVSNTNELDSVLEIYAPGDTIHIMKGFTYTKDLVFNRPVNLYLDGQTLKVFGNVMFSFNTKVEISSGNSVVMNETCTLNTTSGGRLIVCAVGISGGNFTVNTPASEFVFKGTNSQTVGGGDIYVQNDLMLTASYEKGIVIDGARIYSTDVNGEIPTTVNNFKTIRIGNGTHVTVNSGSEIGDLKASTQGVYLMSVLNNGIINDVNFANMYQDETIVNMPQIYLYNNGQINNMPITLASWSKRFYPSLPDNNGNTRIIQGYAGNNMTVTEYNFKNGDIEVIAPDQLVTKVNGDPTNLLVYYTDTSEQTYTLESLLTEFYASSDGGDSGANIVVKLQIRTSGSKVISQEDYNYLRYNYPLLEDLDMTECSTYVQKDLTVNLSNNGSHSVTGNYAVVPKDALRGLSNLKNVNLPGNTQVIMNNALAGTAVEEIYLPNTLLYFERVLNKNEYALHGIKYVHITTESQVVGGWSSSQIGWDQLYSKTSTGRLFVPASMVEAYRTNTTYEYYNNASINRRIIAEATRDESGNYFIRQLGTNEYEIAAYVGGQESDRIPANDIYKQGSAGTGLPLRITSIGEYAYAGVITDGTANLFFDENIRSLGNYAFYQFNAQSIDFTTGTGAITSIGNYAFARSAVTDVNLTLTSLNLDGVQTLGSHAFYGQNALSGLVQGDSVQSIGSYAFAYARYITDLRFPELHTVQSSAFGWMHGLVVCYAPKLTSFGVHTFYANNQVVALALFVSGRVESYGTTYTNTYFARSGNRYALQVLDNNTPIQNAEDQYKGIRQDGSIRWVVNNVTQEYYNTTAVGDEIHYFGDYTVDDLYLSNGVPLREATSAHFDADENLYLMAVDKENARVLLVASFFYTIKPESRTYTIPTSITVDGVEYPITDIARNAFLYNDIDLDELYLPETVETIGQSAFGESTVGKRNFASANIPQAIKQIDASAFSSLDFQQLKPNGDGTYTASGHFDLYGCTTVGNSAFAYNDYIVSLVGNQVLTVGSQAFRATTKMQYVRMDKVTTIGSSAFSAHNTSYALNTVIMPSLTTFSGGAVFEWQPLRLVVVGTLTGSPNGQTIQNAQGQTVTIVSTATNIDTAVTCGTAEDNRVVLTRSAHEIGYPSSTGFSGQRIIADDYDFYTELYYEDGRLVWNTTTGDTIGRFLIAINRTEQTAQIITTLDNKYDEYDFPTSVTVGDVEYPVTSIAENAWRYHSVFNEDNLVLPETLVTIKANAFYQRAGLSAVVFPSNLQTIGNAAFYQTGITGEVDLPNVKTLGNSAFSSCAGITGVYAPNCETMGTSVFNTCSNLRIVSAQNCTTISDNTFINCYKLEFVYLPKVTHVPYRAFYRQNGTTTRIVVVGVLTNKADGFHVVNWFINSDATSDATQEINSNHYGISIMGRDLANGVYNGVFSSSKIIAPQITADGLYFASGVAFKDLRVSHLDGLVDVVYHVNDDGSATFVTNLKSAIDFDTMEDSFVDVFKAQHGENVVDHTVTHIADRAFYYNKTSVTSTMPIYLPNQLQVIGNEGFQVANNITATYASMVFPSTLTEIGNNAFYGEILNGDLIIQSPELKYIGYNAFRDSGEKTKVLIECNSLEEIGYCSFYNCDVPDGDFTLASTSLETVGYQSFQNIACQNFIVAASSTATTTGGSTFQGVNATETIKVWGFDTITGDNAFHSSGAKAIYLYDVKRFSGHSTFTSSANLEYIYAPNVIELHDQSHLYCGALKLTVYGTMVTYGEGHNATGVPDDQVFVLNDGTGLDVLLNSIGNTNHRTVMNQALADKYTPNQMGTYANRHITGEHTFEDYYLSNGVKLVDATYEMLNIPGIAIVALNDDGTYEYVVSLTKQLHVEAGLFTLPTFSITDGEVTTDYVASVISENAFRYATGSVTEFRGAEKVTLVRKNAFNGCKVAIDKLYLNNVETIETSAFEASLVTQVWMDGTVEMQNNAFYDVNTLTNLHLGEQADLSLGDYVFYSCGALTDFDFTQISAIGEECFRGDVALRSVRLSDQITSLGNYVFRDTAIVEFIAPNVVSIGVCCLYGIEELRYLYAPELKYVGDEGLRFASGLEIAVFGELSTMGTYAWLQSTISGIVIVNTDGTLDQNQAFTITTNLFGATTPCIMSTAGAENLYTGSLLSSNKFLVDNLNISTLYFDNGVNLVDATYATLGKYLLNAESDHAMLLTSTTSQVDFEANQMPNSITLPDGDTTKELTVTHIYQKAFTKRTITAGVNLILPSGLTHVGDDAFDTDKTVQVASITFPTTLVEVGNDAFRYLSSLADITLDCPNLVSVGERAFSTTFAGTGVFTANLPSLVSVGTNAFYGIKASVINFTANGEAVFGDTVFSTSSAKEIYVTGVKDLGYQTFTSSANLHTVYAPDVMYGSYMFAGCGALAYVYVPNRTSMLTNEFWGLKNGAVIVTGRPSELPNANSLITGNPGANVLIVLTDDTTGIAEGATVAQSGGRMVMSDTTNAMYASSQLSNQRIPLSRGIDLTKLYLYNGTTAVRLDQAKGTDVTANSALLQVIETGKYNYVSHVYQQLVYADENATYTLPEVSIGGVDYYATEIAPYAFRHVKGNFGTFDVGEQMETIGDYAFNDRGANLTFVTLNLRNTTTVGDYAFNQSTVLTTVTSTSTQGINFGNRAFNNSDNLVTVGLESGEFVLGEYVFNDCGNLQTLSTNGVSTFDVGTGAFYKCVKFGATFDFEQVVALDSLAFYDCDQIRYVKLRNSITYLPQHVFNQCSRLDVLIAEGVTELGDYALYYAGGTDSRAVFYIPNATVFGVEAIRFAQPKLVVLGNPMVSGSNAFDCSTIHKTVFLYNADVSEQTKVNSGGSWANDYFVIQPDSLYNDSTTYNISTGRRINSGTHVITDYVTQNGVYLKDITSASQLDTLCAINNDQTFDIVMYLSATPHDDAGSYFILKQDSYTPVGSFTMGSGEQATTYTLKNIGMRAYFYVDMDVNYLTMPETLQSIDTYAFYATNDVWEKHLGIVDLANTNYVGQHAFSTNNTAANTITTVTSTADSLHLDTAALRSQSKLTQFTATGDVTFGSESIRYTAMITLTVGGDAAFGASTIADCATLTTVTVGGNVTEVASSAFSSCVSMTTFPFEKITATTIGSNAFRDCDSITSVTLGPDVKYLEDTSFYLMDNLTYFRGDGVKRVIGSAVRGSPLLQVVYLPELVEAYNDGLFYGLSNLKLFVAGEMTTFTNGAWIDTPANFIIIINGDSTPLTADQITGNGAMGSWPDTTRMLRPTDYDPTGSTYSIDIGATTIDQLYVLYESGSIVHISQVTTWENAKGVVKLYEQEGQKVYDYLVYAQIEPNYETFTLPTVTLSNTTYYPKSVGDSAFRWRTTGTLGKVILPETVTYLGDNVFGSSVELSEFHFEGLEYIGINAFASKVLSVVNGSTEGDLVIADSAFSGANVASMTFPFEQVVSVGTSAFYNSFGPVHVKLSNSLTSLPNSAFRQIPTLLTFQADGVTEVGQYAVSNNTSLVKIVLPSLKKTNGYYPFENNDKVEYFEMGAINQSDTYSNHFASNTEPTFDMNTLYVMNDDLSPAVSMSTELSYNEYRITVLTNYANKGFMIDTNDVVYMPEGKTIKNDLRTYGTHTVNGVTLASYYYVSMDDGLYLVYCALPTVTGEQLSADIVALATANAVLNPEDVGKVVTTIGERAFRLTQITGNFTIPDGVVRLENNAFNFHKGYEFSRPGLSATATDAEDYAIPNLNTNQVQYVGTHAFKHRSIEHVVLGESIQTLTANAFDYSTKLTDGTYPDYQKSVTLLATNTDVSVGANNFSANSDLYVSMQVFDYYYGKAFGRIPKNTAQSFDSSYEDDNGVTFYYQITESANPYGKVKITAIAIRGTFNGTLTIPTEIVTVDDEGFEVTYTVSEIDRKAFAPILSNDSIRIIVLPTNLSEDGFQLAPTDIPVGVEEFSIGNSRYFSVDSEGVLYDKNKTQVILYPIGKTDATYTLPAGMTSVNLSAFAGNPYLQQIIYTPTA